MKILQGKVSVSLRYVRFFHSPVFYPSRIYDTVGKSSYLSATAVKTKELVAFNMLAVSSQYTIALAR